VGVAFYPAQRVTVGGTEIPIVQSASAAFEIPKKAIYKFGQYTAVANIVTEAPSATFQFSYILSTTTNTANLLGVSQLQSSLADFTVGKTCVLGGAGTFTLTKAFLTSFSVEGSVGDVVNCSASFEGTEATFSPSTATVPIAGSSSNVEIVSPDVITASVAGGTFPCRSFNFSIDVPREKIFKFGTFTPHATIPNRAPTAKIEAEIILGDGAPSISNNSLGTKLNSSINCGGVIYSLSNAKISSYSADASIDGPLTAKITLEQELENLSDVSIGG